VNNYIDKKGLFLNVSFVEVIIQICLMSIKIKFRYVICLFSQIQYVEDDEDGRSDDGDGSDSPRPFDK
jgi:hypothetical protein